MKKILLCILDGFGCCDSEFGNATIEAKFITSLINSKEKCRLDASGISVGLPKDQFGNSEVGHLTIGAGRVIKQKLPMINDAIDSGELSNNPKLTEFLNNAKNKTCHLMGLFSTGGVHSELKHFLWAIEFLRNSGITIKSHIFLDGRDVGYRDALDTLSKAIQKDKIRISEIATIQGRFYAMDRDKKLDRTEIAYDAIVCGSSKNRTNDPLTTIKDFYLSNINDENMPPIIVGDYSGAKPNESFWMINFRTDRIKQILKMLLDNDFKVMNMVDCGDEIDSKSITLFERQDCKNSLGQVLSEHGIKQLRIAETEKYAHVTYFFNGGKEIQYKFEDRILIPSPNVLDYADTPAMSSEKITDEVLKAIKDSNYQVVIVNFANADMVGHTGNFDATKKSLQILDSEIRTIVETAVENEFTVILTADHGNAEEMMIDNVTPKKTHTCSLVPFVVIPHQKLLHTYGTLSDIAPTILYMLGIPIPNEMTGKILVK